MARKPPPYSGPPLPPPNWHDASGRNIVRGNYVAYSINSGRRARMIFGIVTELVQKRAVRSRYVAPPAGQPPHHGSYVQDHYMQPKVRVLSSYGTTAHKTTYEKLGNMLVVEEHQVPAETLRVLREAWQGASGPEAEPDGQ